MKPEDMNETPDTKSDEENMCVVINDTIKSKSDEVVFLNELKTVLSDSADISKEVKGLVDDSQNYIKVLDTIKNKTGCCKGNVNETG